MQKPRAEEIKLSVWINSELLSSFKRIHPTHGALTRFVTEAIRSHVEDANKRAQQLMEQLQ